MHVISRYLGMVFDSSIPNLELDLTIVTFDLFHQIVIIPAACARATEPVTESAFGLAFLSGSIRSFAVLRSYWLKHVTLSHNDLRTYLFRVWVARSPVFGCVIEKQGVKMSLLAVNGIPPPPGLSSVHATCSQLPITPPIFESHSSSQ